MSERLLLRIAAFAMGFVAFGHTVGGMMLAKSHGRGEDVVLAALRSYHFDVMGVSRSHADFYAGEGWFLSIALIAMTLLCWQLGSIVDEHRKLVWRLILGPLAYAVVGVWLCMKYFFPAPLAGMTVAAISLAVCFLRLNR